MNNISDFKSFLIIDKKLTENTVEAYLSDIMKFLNFANIDMVSGCETELFKQFDNYLTLLEKSNISASTQNRSLTSMRLYFDYLIYHNIITSNPANGIKYKKNTHSEITVLEKSEIVKFLSITNKTIKGLRDKAILELLYATGIKVSELINIQTTNVNFKLGLLNINNGRSIRTLPIKPEVLKTLYDYLTDVRPQIISEDTDLLFTNMQGRMLTRQGLWKLIKYYSNLAGIKKEIDISTLRHTFAVHTLENGADIEYVSQLLGNRDINSTKQYTRYIHNKYSSTYKNIYSKIK